ncbi:MAG TPA: 2-dehydropantoate 2-reductase N-terminal domain-containing protein, partial [Chloroflexia bacterium]|nr:2-dehydropantoate 2-reductase N-terminal domain-containing protein [Chloroflexia bacterium]
MEGRGTGRVTVVGTGSWGTTLAILAAQQGQKTYLLARTHEEAEQLKLDAENRRFMPGFPFPSNLMPTADAHTALEACDMLLMVVPSQTMRANIRTLKPHLCDPKMIVVSAAKGLELG